MNKFRVNSTHAEVLESGKPLAPGSVVELTDEQVQQNPRLVDEGILVPVEPQEEDQ